MSLPNVHGYQYVDPNPYHDDGSDGCLLFPDYASAELRVIAAISQCQGMIDNFAENRDPHCYVTRMIYSDIIPNDASDAEIKDKYKNYRYRAKWTNWTFLYGGGKGTLVAMYGLDETEAADIEYRYYSNFPEIKKYQQDRRNELKTNGFVSTPFGRRLPIPGVRDKNPQIVAKSYRTAINMPIQATASDILLLSLGALRMEMKARHFKSMLVNTVHDSIVIDVYPGELTDLMELVTDVMENVNKKYAQKYYPSMDFSWLTVPMKSDMDHGDHYGTYSSDKDDIDRFTKEELEMLNLNVPKLINHLFNDDTSDPEVFGNNQILRIPRPFRTLSGISI